MNPVFKEYLDFLQINGINTEKYGLKEGFYWLDRMIIKGFDKDGNTHKILRIKVDEDMNITSKDYGRLPSKGLVSWKELYEIHKDRIDELEKESIELIKGKMEKCCDKIPTILTSGGKDSNLTTYLVRRVRPDTEAIFNNTSLDCADTYKYIKKQSNTRILNPKEGFYQWRERNNFVPTRFSRACCSLFKEGETVNQLDKDESRIFFLGMRNAESNNRSNYGDEWKNEKWGERDWDGILPIRKWNELDVWLYTIKEDIHINSKYKKGYARVGCACACPYYTKSTWILDKYWYPTLYNRWHEIIENDFIDNNKWTIMNCTIKEYHTCWNGGVYREDPTDEVIQEFADHNDLDFDIAKSYFNNRCPECNKRVKAKEDIAMNLKYLGRNTSKVYCKKHLKEYLSELTGEKFTNEKWNKTVLEFKNTGCDLF